MFKKLLLIAFIFAGFNTSTAGAIETPGVLQAAASKGGALAWLKHFAVAHLCYKVIFKAEKKAMDALFPLVELDTPAAVLDVTFPDGKSAHYQSQRKNPTINSENIAIHLLAHAAIWYGCYKLTNYLHQQMSDEPYRWAHLLGALL